MKELNNGEVFYLGTVSGVLSITFANSISGSISDYFSINTLDRFGLIAGLALVFVFTARKLAKPLVPD